MTTFKKHATFNLARGTSAHLSFEVGLTRNGAPGPGRGRAAGPDGAAPYLELMKRCLTGQVCAGKELRRLAAPEGAFTMIGRRRLDNLQFCVEGALAEGVPGDMIEAGVWRGGASIFMRAVLEAHGVRDRRVWVADSFRGLPPPDAEKYPEDAGDELHAQEVLAVSLKEVRQNFRRFGLLDDRVRFLEGWFRDTLPAAPTGRLAVVRLDGDMYESTMDGLANLYPRLSPGGYLIVDDYGGIEACRKAVHDYRAEHGITEEILRIDWNGVYWRRADPRA